MIRAFALALLLIASPALAERTVAQYSQACGLTGTSSSIVADVYSKSAATALLATVPNGSMTRVAGTSDCYVFAISSAAGIGYPIASDATEKHFLVKFRDDSANEVWDSVTVAGVAGATGEIPDKCKQETAFYANSPIPSRGLTQRLINEGLPSYIKIDVACDGDFTTPDASFFKVRYYDSTGRRFKEVPSSSAPNP